MIYFIYCVYLTCSHIPSSWAWSSQINNIINSVQWVHWFLGSILLLNHQSTIISFNPKSKNWCKVRGMDVVVLLMICRTFWHILMWDKLMRSHWSFCIQTHFHLILIVFFLFILIYGIITFRMSTAFGRFSCLIMLMVPLLFLMAHV